MNQLCRNQTYKASKNPKNVFQDAESHGKCVFRCVSILEWPIKSPYQKVWRKLDSNCEADGFCAKGATGTVRYRWRASLSGQVRAILTGSTIVWGIQQACNMRTVKPSTIDSIEYELAALINAFLEAAPCMINARFRLDAQDTSPMLRNRRPASEFFQLDN